MTKDCLGIRNYNRNFGHHCLPYWRGLLAEKKVNIPLRVLSMRLVYLIMIRRLPDPQWDYRSGRMAHCLIETGRPAPAYIEYCLCSLSLGLWSAGPS